MEKKLAAIRSWSDLPTDIVPIIFRKLVEMDDIVGCAAVCSSWKSVFDFQYPQLKSIPFLSYVNKPILPPFLLVSNINPIEDSFTLEKGEYDYEYPDQESCILFNTQTHKIHEISLPELKGRWFCSSSYGWLFTIPFRGTENAWLLNPFTKARIELPPLPIPPYPGERRMHFRVITSSSPLNPNCMVLATHLDALELAFCRPGDNKWTRICGDLQRRLGPYYCNDTIFYEDEFYVVDRTAELFRIDFGLSSAVKLTLDRTYTTLFNYLVELNGDLLLVTRPKNVVTPPAGTRSITTHGEHFGDPLYYRTTVFRIFKMDWHEGKWVFDKIKNIGNNAILLGKHSSSSFPVDGGIADFQANCIYFIDDCEITDRSKLPDIGAYNLETQRIEWLYEHSTVWTSPLNWFRVH